MEKVLDTGLIARSMDFHGSQMKKQWETERGENDLQLINVEEPDYTVFQERQKHLSFQDRGKRLKLHQFIAKQANVLFDEVLNVRAEACLASPPIPPEAHHAVLPPFDTFASLDPKERTQHFFEVIKPGDLVIGPLISRLSTGYMMKILCSDGKYVRVVADLGIKAVIQTLNLSPAVDKKNLPRTFQLNDLVCCEVLEVVASSEKLYVGMKGDVCPQAQRPRLGLVQNEELPQAFKKWQEGMTETYDEMLENSIGFRNPGNIKCLSDELGLGIENYSHFASLRFGFPTEECASELRQAQSSKWAYRSVSDGIANFKAGRHAEAFQCLNKALTIDTNNIEALVARGALYANGGSFKKAIEDFDSALKINPNHQNARKYMAETLIAFGRSHEEENKWDEALAAYERCLTIAPFHEEARNSIEYVKAKQGAGMAEPETIPLLTPGKAQGVKETLKQLLAQAQEQPKPKKTKKKKEKKAKKRKNRSSSSSSTSSTSSSSSTDSSSSDSSSGSSQDSHHKRKHKRKGEHKDRSLSPLSKRMALMDSVTTSSFEVFDGITSQKGSHYNPPSMPFSFTSTSPQYMDSSRPEVGGKPSVESEYETRVRKFLEQTKGDEDYEDKVRKFLEETAKWKKERKAQEDKKKKKKKEKKANKKNRKKKREERKKLKKAAKEEKMRREGKRRRSNSNMEDEDGFNAKTELSHLILDNIPDLEDLQSKLSAYYAKVDKGPKNREVPAEKILHKMKSASPNKSYERESKERSSSHEPQRKSKKEVDMFEDSSTSPEVEKSDDEGRLPPQAVPGQHGKFKMQLSNIGNKLKKKESGSGKGDDSLPETWDDIEEKVSAGGALMKEVAAPPPPPPTKDEMVVNLKKIVEKKKEAIEAKAPVMDKLGGFRINPAAVKDPDHQEAKRKPSRERLSDSDSEPERKPKRYIVSKRSTSSRSRSRSPPPKRKYSVSESSGPSYKGRRSRSKSGSYSRPRRYRSSESGSYRSGSYSRSRSRSRSGEYRRSRSRSDDRSYRNKYPGRYPRNRGTYYRPRFQNNSGNFKNRGYINRGGYRNNRGGGYRDYRDYRNRGFPRNRGRGRGGQRYFHYRPREREYNRRYERGGGSRSEDDDSPMRKVDAAKERIDKMLSSGGGGERHHSGPLSEGEERDDDYVDRKDYEGKWKEESGAPGAGDK